MAIKPMSTLSFNGGDAFEIIDQEARNNIAELKELHPATGKVGQILEVETVDKNGKPLTYRAVDNSPDIDVDETLTQKGMAADAKATGEALKNISVDETLTLAEYQALSEEEKDSNKTFYIDDEDIININDLVKITASHIAFDNANTTLVSREVQGALVEVDNKIENVNDAIDGLSEQIDEQNEIAREFISDIYDETKTYTVDSYCINDNKLYKCTTETTGSFDGSCWKETNMTDELVAQSIAISEQNKNMASMNEWKLVNSSIGKTEIILPEHFTEIIIETTDGATNCYTFHLCKSQLTEDYKSYYSAICNGKTQNYVEVCAKLTSVYVKSFKFNDSDKSSSALNNVYYR